MLYGKQIRADSKHHVLGILTIAVQYKRVDSLQKLRVRPRKHILVYYRVGFIGRNYG